METKSHVGDYGFLFWLLTANFFFLQGRIGTSEPYPTLHRIKSNVPHYDGK